MIRMYKSQETVVPTLTIETIWLIHKIIVFKIQQRAKIQRNLNELNLSERRDLQLFSPLTGEQEPAKLF